MLMHHDASATQMTLGVWTSSSSWGPVSDSRSAVILLGRQDHYIHKSAQLLQTKVSEPLKIRDSAYIHMT